MEIDELRRRRDEIERIAARHGAKNVRVFGSIVRGQARRESDVDLLVDMEPGRSLLDLIRLELELEEALDCEVDALTSAGVSELLRDRILEEAVAL
jgi:hypothetical protein